MSEIVTQTSDGVLTITINRPDKKNALTQAMYGAMADALEAAETDAAVRAVLIAGVAGAFTAGNDLQDFLSNPPRGENAPEVGRASCRARVCQDVSLSVVAVSLKIKKIKGSSENTIRNKK